MALPLTPALLEATYEFLRRTPPFHKWNLPPGEVVTFKVTRNAHVQGDHLLVKGKHTIRASSKKTGNTHNLIELMAHEMVHAKCDLEGVRAEHGAEFKRAARAVCKAHGFDEKNF